MIASVCRVLVSRVNAPSASPFGLYVLWLCLWVPMELGALSGCLTFTLVGHLLWQQGDSVDGWCVWLLGTSGAVGWLHVRCIRPVVARWVHPWLRGRCRNASAVQPELPLKGGIL